MRGDIRVVGDDVYLDLGGEKETVFDAADTQSVVQHRWYYLPPTGRSTKEYALGRVGRRTTSLHRYLMNAAKGEEIDHHDHDGLNNRRKNLRRTTHSENLHNATGPQKNSKTGVLGVHPEKTKSGMRYVAAVEKDGRPKKKFFPYTPDGLEAAGKWVGAVRTIALSDADGWARLFAPRPLIVCPSCRRTKKHKAHGLCKSCYERESRRKARAHDQARQKSIS